MNLIPHQLRAAVWPVALALVACSGDGGAISGPDDEVAATAIRTDRFEQVRRPRLDFLWVVDNTRSMSDAQPLLVETYRAFFSQISEAGVAYQVGIVTADKAERGGGRLLGQPWILTSATPDARDHFLDTVQVDVADDASSVGLEAMRAALSPPLSEEANRGFLRPDAQLLIYIVSDSDDGSTWPGTEQEIPVSEYERFLRALKAGGESPVVSAIIGDPEVGCTSGAVNAQAGDRYSLLVEQTGGVVVSICDPGERLSREPLSLPEKQASFELSFVPSSENLAVWVDSVRAPAAQWSVSGKTLSFVDGSIPDYDTAIRVQYLYELEAQ